jgi:hypothetical protein
VIQASRRDTSPDLRTIKPSLAQPREAALLRREVPNPLPPKVLEGEVVGRQAAPSEPSPLTTTQLPDPLFNF